MILPEFQFHRPRSIEEALRLAREFGEEFDYIAGGTDLLQNYKDRINPRKHVISLAALPELSEITPTRIGSLVTLDDLGNSPVILERYPAISETVGHIASPLVRMSGTVGGNVLVETRCFWFNQTEFWRNSIGNCLKADGDVCRVVPQAEVCYATYSGDLAPVFMALGGSLRLVGSEGARDVPLRDFFSGDGIAKNVKRRDEIITHILLPEDAHTYRSGYRKLRLREAFDYPELGVAAALRYNGGRAVQDLQVVLSGVHATPTAYPEITNAVVGKELTAEVIDEISREIQAKATPVKNTALGPSYRKKMVGVFLKRLLSDLAKAQ